MTFTFLCSRIQTKLKLPQISKTGFKWRCQRSLAGNFGIDMMEKNPFVCLCQCCSHRVTTLWFAECWRIVDFLFVHGLSKNTTEVASLAKYQRKTVDEFTWSQSLLYVGKVRVKLNQNPQCPKLTIGIVRNPITTCCRKKTKAL